MKNRLRALVVRLGSAYEIRLCIAIAIPTVLLTIFVATFIGWLVGYEDHTYESDLVSRNKLEIAFLFLLFAPFVENGLMILVAVCFLEWFRPRGISNAVAAALIIPPTVLIMYAHIPEQGWPGLSVVIPFGLFAAVAIMNFERGRYKYAYMNTVFIHSAMNAAVLLLVHAKQSLW